ncbi:MAG: MotA/TolQ/ExbB proton channel family protein [SAR324 cluster bacterium]|jgi:chemotaxis protein MotA|uniref:MotA/TolQ/ExbB proton channel domain-containing protein n=1 Tax=marine metagenome TaxID=408172 RepID=A0A381RHG6_9ZZZZ|nr:MotA/TolQ/ExbB proton channel family protein [SAR324 cluster bacterium]|tara:strand:- start:639 stop:1607 length:969 start_codon:yes stop_codon:yes gene_type:complete
MLDKIGTLLGMLLGASLVIFGIIWPDHLSNYYMFQFREFERGLESLKASQASIEDIRALKASFKVFQDSWLGSVSRFADLKSLLIVLGGSYAATLIAFRFGDAMRAILFIAKAFLKGKAEKDFLEVYHTVINLCEKRANNELITDEEISAVKNTDLQNWLQDFIAVDLVTEEMIEEIVRSEIEMYNYRSFEEIDMLEFMGRASPAFGMIGTVVGLILMLGSVSGEGGADIAGLMGGMAVALITTLYGVLLSQLIFLPIASKRFQLKESQVLLMEMIREGLLYLKRRELPETAAKDLVIYLPPKLRKKVIQEEQAAMGEGLRL